MKNCLNKVDKFRCKLLMKKNMNKRIGVVVIERKKCGVGR